MKTNPWEGLRELLSEGNQLNMSPEAAARYAAETLAHRRKLKEQEECRNALWARLGGKKETMLYTYHGEEYFYDVSVAYGVSWDGWYATVDVTIGGDGYPSRFDFGPSAALKLMKRIEQEAHSETMSFTVAGDDYWHHSMGIRGDFSLSQETVLNLLQWLRQEQPLLEELASKEASHEVFHR